MSQMSNRVRRALVLIVPVLAVVALFATYRFTSPGSSPSATGTPAAESDVLQVGALPVT